MTHNPLDTSIFNVMIASAGMAPAGANLSFRPSVHVRDRILVISCTLVTDATVLDRYVRWKLTDGTNNCFVAWSNYKQQASETFTYLFVVDSMSLKEASLLHVSSPLPPDLFTTHDIYLQSDVLNLQAGDRFHTEDYIWARQCYPE